MEYQPQGEKYTMCDLLAIMRILRSEQGCPWDRVQTHESIRMNFVEEVYEALEAIDRGDTALLKEELGDVLLQVVFHSAMEEEQAHFSFEDVVHDVCDKLIVRHPHLFGSEGAVSAEDALTNWNEVKRKTKGQKSYTETLQSVSKALPGLMRVQKLHSRTHKAGVTLPDVQTVSSDIASLSKQLTAETDPQKMQALIGKLLYRSTLLAQLLGVDAEELLEREGDAHIARFAKAEAEAADLEIKDCDQAMIQHLIYDEEDEIRPS